jgi:hypothetical protein
LKAIPERKRACNENSGPETTLIYSDAPFQPAANGWGGPRNSASRTSDYIKLETALEFVDAARWALAARMPFNRHMTIHWAMSGISDSEAAEATGRYVKLIGDWVKKQGGSFAHGWAREMGPLKGTHAHLLLHIPKGLKLGHMTRRWLRTVAGDAPAKAIRTKTIGGSAAAGFSGSEWYECNLASLVAYLLKGVSPESGELLGLDRFASGGRIIGKRVSISQNLRFVGRGLAKVQTNQHGQRSDPEFRSATVETSTQGRGHGNPRSPRTGKRSESPVISLTANFSGAHLARARARLEHGNQNFTDELGSSGEVA